MSALNGSRPNCTQPSCHRTATLVFRALGGSEVPSCTRCAGSVLLRVAGECGALVEVIGRGSFENRRRRERQLASRRAA